VECERLYCLIPIDLASPIRFLIGGGAAKLFGQSGSRYVKIISCLQRQLSTTKDGNSSQTEMTKRAVEMFGTVELLNTSLFYLKFCLFEKKLYAKVVA
jgi:hypothetical protein